MFTIPDDVTQHIRSTTTMAKEVLASKYAEIVGRERLTATDINKLKELVVRISYGYVKEVTMDGSVLTIVDVTKPYPIPIAFDEVRFTQPNTVFVVTVI